MFTHFPTLVFSYNTGYILKRVLVKRRIRPCVVAALSCRVSEDGVMFLRAPGCRCQEQALKV